MLRWVFAGLVLAFLAGAVVSQWNAVADALRQLDYRVVTLAFIFVLGGLMANMLSWRSVLAGLGSPLPIPAAAGVYLSAQLGKYLPGSSVWTLLAQAELGRDHGVPRLRSGTAGLASLVVGIVVGMVVAAFSLTLAAVAELEAYAWILFTIPVGLAVLHPRVLQGMLGLAMRILGDTSQPGRVEGRALLVSAGWSAVMWLFLGGQIYVLAGSLGASGTVLPLISLGAYAAAWVAGFFVMVVPAGGGTREAVLALALSPVLPMGSALALALVSRVLMVLGDLVSVGGVLLLRNLGGKRPE